MKYGLAMVGLDNGLFKAPFTEHGTITGLKKLNKPEEDYTAVTFEFKFGSGDEDKGSGTITRYKDGTVDAMYEGSVMMGGKRFEWQSIETGKVDKDGKTVKGLEIVTFPHSPEQNSFIMETEMDLSDETFTNTVYQWK
jgi:hypothetical protein